MTKIINITVEGNLKKAKGEAAFQNHGLLKHYQTLLKHQVF